jgi:hypothetical protein
MMFRLQEQFQLDPNQNIIIEGTPDEPNLSYRAAVVHVKWKHRF